MGAMHKVVALLGVGMGGDGELRNFSKQFFPRRVKLALEGIYGRGGYNRSREPVPVFYDSSGKG